MLGKDLVRFRGRSDDGQMMVSSAVSSCYHIVVTSPSYKRMMSGHIGSHYHGEHPQLRSVKCPFLISNSNNTFVCRLNDFLNKSIYSNCYVFSYLIVQNLLI